MVHIAELKPTCKYIMKILINQNVWCRTQHANAIERFAKNVENGTMTSLYLMRQYSTVSHHGDLF